MDGSPEMSQKFGPELRLHTRAEFVAVQNSGRRAPAKFMTLLGRPNGLDRDRLGLVASRRVGGAVARNRAKRRLRELFRRQDPERARERGRQPMDIVAIARADLATAPFAAVETDFHAALRRLRGAR
jgi:ribonuclease P protein component